MRRIFCRRFGGSISPGNLALSRKSDRGIAESVKAVANGQAGFGTALGMGARKSCRGDFNRQAGRRSARRTCTGQLRCPWRMSSPLQLIQRQPQVRPSPTLSRTAYKEGTGARMPAAPPWVGFRMRRVAGVQPPNGGNGKLRECPG
ncbi:hypothetical protein E8F11_12650 [Pseudomonas sp. BN417]|nr:hypothetical protein [Pseudomonas sp. BN417]